MSVKIGIVGDCGNSNNNTVLLPEHIRDELKKCDIFVFNLEGPITYNMSTVPNGPYNYKITEYLLSLIGKKQPIIENDVSLLQTLNLADVNIACLGNNHILDLGAVGLKNTIECLNHHNYRHVGAGMNKYEASRPLEIEYNGINIAITNYNFVGWRRFGLFVDIFGAGDSSPGANYKDFKEINDELQVLKNKNDYVIPIFHIGRVLSKCLKKTYLQNMKELDADKIFTHHPHIIQNIDSNFILSCGDFIYNSNHLPNDRGGNVYIWELGNELNVIKTNPSKNLKLQRSG